MTRTDADEHWLREQLGAAVPAPPGSTDRLARLRAGRQQARRRRAAAVVVCGCLAVVGATVAAPMLLAGGDRPEITPTDPSTTTAAVAPTLDCPPVRVGESDRGPATLATGAMGARLCDGGLVRSAGAPRDILSLGLDALVASVNAQPKGSEACFGPLGDRYLLLLAYPDGTERRVSLDFSGCGSLRVGTVARHNPDQPYEKFMDLLGQQRATATPPAGDLPDPVCLAQHTGMSAIADPGEMVAARLCVTYNDNGRTTSVAVPAADLETILEAWRTGPKTPEEKGPGCGPTTPTWVLSGVTRWADSVQITAECDRPTNGQDWVTLSPTAQAVIDRLVAEAGVQVAQGDAVTTAWQLAADWLGLVNTRALISYDKSAAAVGDMADKLWVRDPWLPEGELDWDLLAASPTQAAGWAYAWRVPARTPEGQAVFTIVRDDTSDPWRILSLNR
jgi:hypothetical protein